MTVTFHNKKTHRTIPVKDVARLRNNALVNPISGTRTPVWSVTFDNGKEIHYPKRTHDLVFVEK